MRASLPMEVVRVRRGGIRGGDCPVWRHVHLAHDLLHQHRFLRL